MRDIIRDEKGGVAVLTGCSLIVLIGFAVLAVDSGWVFSRSTKISNVADATAISGATVALPIDLDVTNPGVQTHIDSKKNEILNVANANVGSALSGSVVGLDNIVFGCWENNLFTAGGQCSDGLSNALRITAQQNNVSLFFASVWGKTTTSVTRQATTARLPQPACLITLNKKAGSLRYNGNIELDMQGCGIHVNGGISGANNTPEIDTSYLCANQGSEKSDITSHPAYVEQCGEKKDPYENLAVETSGLSNHGKIKTDHGENANLSPGVYTGIEAGGNVTLQPGLYVIDGGTLSVKGDFVGNGVTIVLKNGASVEIGGNGSATLTAPTSGTTKGYAIIQNDGETATSQMGGGGNLELEGVFYLKNQILEMKGNPNIDSNRDPWATFVVGEMDIRGNSTWKVRAPNANEFPNNPAVPTTVSLVQ